MEKRFLSIIGFVILGILLGLVITGKKGHDPVMKELVDQQTQILQNQTRLESKLSHAGAPAVYQGDGGGLDTGAVSALLLKQSQLEQKVAGLEAKIAKLEAAPAPAPQRPTRPQEDPNEVYDIPVDHSYVYGKKDAPVTVVEFVDFQCPFCARFHTPVMEAVKAFPDKVNYMIKHFPLSFHPQAGPASKAAMAAGEQGKFFEMSDLLLEHGKDLNDAKFRELAKELGLNMKKFEKDLENNDAKYQEYIKKDMALGGQVNVRGTPTMYIGGKKTNARDVNSLKAEIERMLK